MKDLIFALTLMFFFFAIIVLFLFQEKMYDNMRVMIQETRKCQSSIVVGNPATIKRDCPYIYEEM